MTIKKNITAVSVALLLICTLWSQTNERKERVMDSLLTAHLVKKGKKPVHNILLYAKSGNDFVYHKGIGEILRKKEKVDKSYQFNTASITKTFVATIILQLEEEGKLSIHDKIGKHLRHLDFINFENLHLFNKRSYSNQITIENLLNHTSGISDVFIDAEFRFNLSVLLHPKKQYTSKSFFQKYYDYNLHKKPHNLPGENYYYSDINYMLLGFIIEEITGEKLSTCIRNRILDPLDMKHTYFEYYEPEKGQGKRIDAFLNRINITHRVNTSYEWAGGGLVSTTKDLSVFIEALFTQKLFKNPNTLIKMTDMSTVKKFGANYGLGIFKKEFQDITFYGHGGFYGSIALYAPRKDLTFIANVSQAHPPFNSGKLIDKLIKTIIE